MNGSDRRDRGELVVLGFLVALGLIIGGWLLGSQIKATRLSDRYVTVRGLVERQVKSDLAIWPLSFKEAGDDLAAVYGRTDTDKNAILQFLSQQGIKQEEIELGRTLLGMKLRSQKLDSILYSMKPGRAGAQ